MLSSLHYRESFVMALLFGVKISAGQTLARIRRSRISYQAFLYLLRMTLISLDYRKRVHCAVFPDHRSTLRSAPVSGAASARMATLTPACAIAKLDERLSSTKAKFGSGRVSLRGAPSSATTKNSPATLKINVHGDKSPGACRADF